MPQLAPGLSAEMEHIVKHADTAAAWGSGDLEVFSTPALVALMESTAFLAVAASLAPGETTVGSRIDIRHLKATPLGMRVRARAELTAVNGPRLAFKVQAWDEVELIGEAEHERFIIIETRFMAKVAQKAAEQGKV